jgi:hypothetical protein
VKNCREKCETCDVYGGRVKWQKVMMVRDNRLTERLVTLWGGNRSRRGRGRGRAINSLGGNCKHGAPFASSGL